METSEWIAVIGVVVTGFFSYKVWRATKESANAASASANAAIESANAAKASNELSRLLLEQSVNKERAVKKQYRYKALQDARKVYISLVNQNPKVNYEWIMSAPKETGFSLEEIATYFSDDEAVQLHKAWESYKRYLDKHWPDINQGKWGFSGNDDVIAATETDAPIQEFHLLIGVLEK
ncbi:hypothetical protein [Brevibacillus porteri]|uniref:Uncharacterized protein n=1 Tax=Brevibacillus porteri TaxID=2126350 RepID=A0ABX5FKR5_9BACL|nr:hypothetical protein [Brevibacillus porteri]MED1803000.1 hypothetical protein [Brevibacillus porteri]MED2134640.1 hypothetical protein [Brevibacillus porteri]MED2748181.1 hypothetical protein [Brevibacillus porteri]MED2817504.1 hypothetical protein [Brevibacillus porteri]MED2898097.1 hypothetical protein [Brevibacillus porteri]